MTLNSAVLCIMCDHRQYDQDCGHIATGEIVRCRGVIDGTGFQQAAQINHLFRHSLQVAIIHISPLQRATQATLAAFPHVLDNRYFDSSSGCGIKNGAKLVIDPGLQERSASCQSIYCALLETTHSTYSGHMW